MAQTQIPGRLSLPGNKHRLNIVRRETARKWIIRDSLATQDVQMRRMKDRSISCRSCMPPRLLYRWTEDGTLVLEAPTLNQCERKLDFALKLLHEASVAH